MKNILDSLLINENFSFLYYEYISRKKHLIVNLMKKKHLFIIYITTKFDYESTKEGNLLELE
jgi:hypothetical protein